VPCCCARAQPRADQLRLRSERSAARRATENSRKLRCGPGIREGAGRKNAAPNGAPLIGSRRRPKKAFELAYLEGLSHPRLLLRCMSHWPVKSWIRSACCVGRKVAGNIVNIHDNSRSWIEAYAMGSLDAADRALIEAAPRDWLRECSKGWKRRAGS